MKTILKIWGGLILFLILLSLMVGATSCNVEKRAANNFYRALRLDKPTVYNECGKIAPPVNKEWDSTGYKQGAGEPEIVYVQVDCDSIVLANEISKSHKANELGEKTSVQGVGNKIKIPCPPCKPRVDTFFKFKTTELVNRATEYAQAETIKEQGETIAGMKVKLNICYAILSGIALLVIVWLIVKWIKK